MAKSLAQIRTEIDRLQRSFDAVIATMKKDIAFHGLSVEDLFGGSTATAAVGAKVNAAPTRRKSTNAPSAPSAPKTQTVRAAKYGDSSGNVWGGMGKRPVWLNAELAKGRAIGSFLLNTASRSSAPAAHATAPAPAKPIAKAVPAKKAGAAKAAPAKKGQPVKGTPAKTAAPTKTSTSVKPAVAAKKLPAKKASPAAKAAAPAKKAPAKAKAALPAIASESKVATAP